MSSRNIIKRFPSARGCIELFALEGRPAVELLTTSPLAGFCLAVNEHLKQPPLISPLATAKLFMTKPQREILGWLGFRPATEAIAKIGRKCIPEALTIQRCRELRKTLRRDEVRHLLAHVPRINAGVMTLVTEAGLLPYLSPQLLQTVSQDSNEDRCTPCADLLRDIYELDLELEHGTPTRRFTSLTQMHERHQELIEEIVRRGGKKHRERLFSAPPVKGIKTEDLSITPVTTVGGLQSLGRAQHNCVASYARRVSGGGYYIYWVLANHNEFTLAIRKTPFGKWEVSEMKGQCNRPAPGPVLRMVHEWLRMKQQPQNHTLVRKTPRARNRSSNCDQLILFD